MPHDSLQRLIGTALVDGEFRASLLASPVDAARESGLSEEEMEVLDSASAESLEELAAHIHAWIIKAPKPRRPSLHRWAIGEGLSATRAAG